MLLRTSSAPVLSSLCNSNFSSGDVFKDLHSPPLLPRRSSCDLHGISAVIDDSRPAHPLPLSRAQSEEDLACFSVAVADVATKNEAVFVNGDTASIGSSDSSRRISRVTSISSFDLKECILEEPERDEDLEPLSLPTGSPFSTQNSLVDETKLIPSQGFALNDGETYSRFEMSECGSPLACNAKGCRPLTQSECKKLGFLDMASGIGFGSGGGFCIRSPPGGPESSNSRDAYYQDLLQADPENSLLLRNYAEFLCKQGDLKRSEEYYERAILADPNDGEVLSQYAKLQWDANRDQDRAEAYYDQATQASPDNCYVMASYASFLWDIEDEESPVGLPPYGATSLASAPLLASA